MLAIQMDLGRFDRQVKIFCALMLQLADKLPFITSVYCALLFLLSFDVWLAPIAPRARFFIQFFLDVPLCALLFCLIFFSLLNSSVNARLANRVALILAPALLLMDSNVLIFSHAYGEFLGDLLSGGLGVFAGYAIVQYYLVTTAIGKWE